MNAVNETKTQTTPQINLYNGDIYEHIHKIPDSSIDLIITDPPYILSGQGGGFAQEVGGTNYNKLIKKQATLGSGFDFSLLKEFERIQPTTNIYIFCNQKLLNKLISYYESKPNIITEILIYHKSNARPQPKNRYKFDIEFCLYIHARGTYLDTSKSGFNGHIYAGQIMCSQIKYTSHPTEKPLQLIESLLLNSSQKGQTILDPFTGSGTTPHACKIHKRNFIGYEIDKEYFTLAQERINNKVQGKLIAFYE